MKKIIILFLMLIINNVSFSEIVGNINTSGGNSIFGNKGKNGKIIINKTNHDDKFILECIKKNIISKNIKYSIKDNLIIINQKILLKFENFFNDFLHLNLFKKKF